MTIARRLTLSTLFLATATLMASAQAQEPTVPSTERALLREARGSYELEDGRMVRVRVGQTRLDVSIDQQRTEAWQAQGADLLVSPDGLRRLRLIRSADGSVDRVALETDRLK